MTLEKAGCNHQLTAPAYKSIINYFRHWALYASILELRNRILTILVGSVYNDGINTEYNNRIDHPTYI